MSTLSIVEHLDVIEDIGTRQVTRFVDPLSNPLLFQRTEEGLDDRVIPAVTFSAHTGVEAVSIAKP